MAHEVETLAYVGEVPWHRLGNPVAEEVRTEEFRKASGLDWDITEEPVFVRVDHVDYLSPKHKGLVRDSDGKILSIVGRTYSPLYMKDFWEVADVVRNNNGFRYNCGASLKDGAKVFCLFKTGELTIADEKHRPYLLLSNSFDQSSSVRVKLTDVRVVCNNTLTLALSRIGDKDVRIVHRGDMKEKVEHALRIIGAFHESMDSFKKDVESMAMYRPAALEMEDFLKKYAPRDKERERVQFLIDESSSILGTPAYGTAWGVVNAFTEFIDHDRYAQGGMRRGKGMEARANTTLFGSGATLKATVFEAMRKLASRNSKASVLVP